MSGNINQAIGYYQQKNYSKAVDIISKINSDPNNQSYLSLQLHGICLAKLTKYQLAVKLLDQAFKFATSVQEKIDTLAALKELALLLKQEDLALKLLIQLVELESTSSSVNYIVQICQLSYKLKDYKTVIAYAEKIKNSPPTQQLANVLLASTYAAQHDQVKFILYFNQLKKSVQNLDQQMVVFLINALTAAGYIDAREEFLLLANTQFQQFSWYQDLVQNVHLIEIDPISKTNILEFKNLVVGDNKEVIKLTSLLLEEHIKQGAVFDKNLRFVEHNGDLSICADAPSSSLKNYMTIPLSCMPLLEDYQFSIDSKGLLLVNTQKNMMNPSAAPVMTLMVKIFNATEKLAHWKSVYPLLSLASYPTLVENLFYYRPMSGKVKRFKSYYDEQQWDKLLVESFIGSREFTYKQASLGPANIQTSNATEKGLLGIIDFLNHKVGDGGYVINNPSAEMAIVSQAESAMDELFVQYGFMDPVQTYLIYGFVDQCAPFIYSGQCEITLPNGMRFKVLSTSGTIKRANTLPNIIAHLSDYLPAGIKKHGNMIVVSDFLIPDIDQKDLLIDVVKQIIMQTEDSNTYTSPEKITLVADGIIQNLAQYNLRFWQTYKDSILLNKIEDIEINENTTVDLLALCDISINHLTPYVKK